MPSVRLPIFWSPNAEHDLIEIWSYLARESADQVADDQLDGIERACATLEHFPYSGRPRDNLLPGVRSIPVHPYVIFYRVRNEPWKSFASSTVGATSAPSSPSLPTRSSALLVPKESLAG
jgi:toxin ParE1/3/4